MKIRLGIGQKLIIVVVAILILFTIGLATVIRNTSLNNLTKVKQAELDRMSQILTRRITEMEQSAVLTARSFEESKPILSEIQLITGFGPYYSDPGSYVPADFKNYGVPIENSAKIYTFQSQLNLIQQLRPVQRLNNFSTISFYVLSPFGIVPEAKPTLALRLEQNGIIVSQFTYKGNTNDSIFYYASWNQFRPPALDYFDISSAYSAAPDRYYRENNFTITGTVTVPFFDSVGQQISEPRSQIVIKDGIPVIQTWYPVKTPLLHPETWAEETVPVGVVVIEQTLGSSTLALLKEQLGGSKDQLGNLDVGLAQAGNLLESSLAGSGSGETIRLAENKTIAFNQGNFYYAQKGINFSDNTSSGLDAIVLSPVSELEQLNQTLSIELGWVSLVAIIVISIIFYLGIQYLVSRPLGGLMRGVELITAGDLSQTVPVRSRDELGQLALAFNGMAGQLRQLIGSLEQQVADRTKNLEIVNALGERLNSILNFDHLLNELVNQVKEQFGYYHTQVYLIDPLRQNIVMAAGAGEVGAQMKAAGHQIPLNAPTSLVARAARTGKIVKADNVYEVSDWLPNPLLPHTHSEMAVPIILEEQVVGVLDVQEDKIAGLDEGDASLLRALANQVAVAIHNARLFSEVETALTEAHELQQRYIEQSWDKTKVTKKNVSRVQFSLGESRTLDENIIAEARQQAMLYQGMTRVDLNINEATNQALVAPITLRGVPIGDIQLHEPNSQREWTEGELALITAVIDQVAQVAESIRLLDESQERASREQLISQISNKMRRAPNLESLMEVAITELSRVLEPARTFVHLGLKTEGASAGGTTTNGENGAEQSR